MSGKTLLTILILLAALIGYFLYDQGQQRSPETSGDRASQRKQEDKFVRTTSKIVYTKHARCRMDCRQIDEAEVAEILEKGKINYAKSEPVARPDPKYALEGYTHDGQQVRIIFAAAEEGMVVITVIDLQKEWNCNCK